MRPIRLHDLRHGAASLRLAAGVDIAVVSKQLGQTNSLTVDTYSTCMAASAVRPPSGPWRWCHGHLVTSR